MAAGNVAWNLDKWWRTMVDELVKTIRLHLADRLTSPLMGAFMVSWCVWNYRVVLLIFSPDTALRKIQLISAVGVPSHAHLWAYPLITSVLYILVYPWPARWAYEYAGWQRAALVRIRRKLENETPLTKEDSIKLRSQFSRSEGQYIDRIEQKDREVDRLTSQVVRLQSLLSEAESREALLRSERADEADGPPVTLNQDVINLLAVVEHIGDEASLTRIVSTAGGEKLPTEVLLNEVAGMGLIRSYAREIGGRDFEFFKLTATGKKALLLSGAR